MTTPAATLVTRTARLELHWAGEHTDGDALLEIFNSNPKWIAATNDFAGQIRCDRSDVEMFLWQGTMGEASRCLEIREGGQDQLVGVLAWIAQHPRDGCPWIGSLVLRADRQRQGLGSEVLQAVEPLLAAEGCERVRAGPLIAQPWARAFLESLGYAPIEERLDQDKRRCMVMEKWLIAKRKSQAAGSRPDPALQGTKGRP
jgi:RimJ/RimL family protein N-acetyltransferase